MRLGVFGGTFNPIHHGHLRAAEEAREILALDRVLFIPSGTPPLKSRELAAAGHRLDMTHRAISGNPFFEVLDIECAAPGKSYTVNTLEKLRDRHPGAEIYFMLGIDAFLDIPNWRSPDRLLELANFAVLLRPGSRFADLMKSPHARIGQDVLEQLDEGSPESLRIALKTSREAVLLRNTPLAISATDIRRRIRSGLSVKYLLPENVESFIISERLYCAEKD